jgi:hypothetical protein
MSFIPRIKKCPCCNSLNVIKTNGVTYENNFQSLNKWTIKKIFNCRKCYVELGLFSSNPEFNEKKIEKLLWMELINCEDRYFIQLKDLTSKKEKYQKQTKRYFDASNTIREIQNKIRSDQVKIKIKAKIKNRIRGMFVVDGY